MATAAQKKLGKEFLAMQREPPPFIWAVPDEKNMLTWNYIIRGPPDSRFAEGEYHEVLLFPEDYPFKPPGIMMLTPSGRFQPGRKICLSISDFHPETWDPTWSVATILTGMLAFMLTDEMTTGSVASSDLEKRKYAASSHAFNINEAKFQEAFPEFCDLVMKDLPNMACATGSNPTTTPNVNNLRLHHAGLVNAVPTIACTIPNPNHPVGCMGLLWRALVRNWKWGAILMMAVFVSRACSK